MQRKYVVLRDRGPELPVTRSPSFGARAQASAELAVESVVAGASEREDLQRDPRVLAVAPTMPMRLIAPMGAPAAVAATAGGMAWGVRAVGADRSPFDGSGIKVAVLDTGCDTAHPAFDGVRFTLRNFTQDPDGDSDGHGTHCAATIFGRAVDGMRIGVAPGVRDVLIGKVLGRRGCSSEEIADAIQWAAEQGAQLISMSLGIDFPGFVEALVERERMPVALATSRALEDYRANVMLFERLAALLNARAQPPVLIGAAGNESRCELDPDFEIAVAPPSVSEGIVSVGALGRGPHGLRAADFSNSGALLSAPGVDIVSARVGGGLAALSGTSMAAPHVAGVAALWLQRQLRAGDPRPVASVKARLLAMATHQDLEPSYRTGTVGAGLVQAPRD